MNNTADKYIEESVEKISLNLGWKENDLDGKQYRGALKKELELLVSETKKNMAKDIINMLEPLSVKGIVSINDLRLLIEERYGLTIN
jgi:hypothetical protein